MTVVITPGAALIIAYALIAVVVGLCVRRELDFYESGMEVLGVVWPFLLIAACVAWVGETRLRYRAGKAALQKLLDEAKAVHRG